MPDMGPAGEGSGRSEYKEVIKGRHEVMPQGSMETSPTAEHGYARYENCPSRIAPDPR